jgi:hypothetical protein
MLSLISMVTPRLVSRTRTFPCATSGAITSRMSLAMLRMLSRCFCLTASCVLLARLGFATGAGVGTISANWPVLLTGTLRKALIIESLRIRYLPSLTEERAYITTKKANSRVMKSAYETSQRSWFSCPSSARFRRATV